MNVCVCLWLETLWVGSLSLSTSSSLAHCTSLSCITCQGTLSAVPCFVSSRALSIQSILLFMRDFRIWDDSLSQFSRCFVSSLHSFILQFNNRGTTKHEINRTQIYSLVFPCVRGGKIESSHACLWLPECMCQGFYRTWFGSGDVPDSNWNILDAKGHAFFCIDFLLVYKKVLRCLFVSYSIIWRRFLRNSPIWSEMPFFGVCHFFRLCWQRTLIIVFNLIGHIESPESPIIFLSFRFGNWMVLFSRAAGAMFATNANGHTIDWLIIPLEMLPNSLNTHSSTSFSITAKG